MEELKCLVNAVNGKTAAFRKLAVVNGKRAAFCST
jgi:hypothetical protein